MSIGSLGVVGSVASSPMAAARSGEVDKNAQESASQTRQLAATEKAEAAAGIGQTDSDEAAQERDADGRRLWEETLTGRKSHDGSPPDEGDAKSRDPTGDVGQALDLSG